MVITIILRRDEFKIDNDYRKGKEGAVEAIQQTAVAGHNLSGIFNVKVSLELRFGQISPHAKEVQQEGEYEAMDERNGKPADLMKYICGEQGCQKASYEAFPRFFGREGGKEFVPVFLAEAHPKDKGAHIGCPKQNKEGEDDLARKNPLWVESQQVGERKGEGDGEDGDKEVGRFRILFDSLLIEQTDPNCCGGDEQQKKPFGLYVVAHEKPKEEKEAPAGGNGEDLRKYEPVF